MSLHDFAFVTPFIFSQSEKEEGGFNISSRKVKGGGGCNIYLYSFAFVTPFIFWQGEKGDGFNMSLHGFPFCHSIHLFER